MNNENLKNECKNNCEECKIKCVMDCDNCKYDNCSDEDFETKCAFCTPFSCYFESK